MNYLLYILLVPTALVLGFNDLACQYNNCSSMEMVETSADESIELFSLDPDLRELYLDDCNNLTILQLTPNLRTLEISSCTWLHFEISDISAAGNLSSLHFRNGSLSRLDRNMFAQLPHLEILGLGGNDIGGVFADAFIGLTQLWMLDLKDNKIIYFGNSVFHPLVKLRHLDISGNGLLHLANAIFDKNLNLQVLLLNRNNLANIKPNTFTILKNLILLDLSNNYITEHDILSAETLILDNSKAYRIDIVGKVSKFQARNNFLRYLRFSEEIFVTELDLHGNRLTTEHISNLLKRMWRLQRLDLSANRAKELPTLEPSMFEENEVYLLPSLMFVNISSNLLEHLNGDSPLLSPSLSHLDVSHNRICEVDPNIFRVVNSLQSLHIEGNRLDHFNYDLFHNQQQGLKEVSLYDNQFTHDSYRHITQYFKDAGIHVLEQANSEELSPVKEDSSMEKCVRTKIKNDDFVVHTEVQSEEQRDLEKSNELEHQQLNTSRKWSSWKIIIFLSLLAALASNAVLVILLRRSRDGLQDNIYLLNEI